MALFDPPTASDGATSRAVVVASDSAVIAMLSTRLQSCGLHVISTIEDIESPSLDFDPSPDLILVHVEPGQEMAAYYVGRAASERGLATLFVAAHAQALAVDALVQAIPHSVLAEQPISDELFAAKIAMALISHRDECL